MLTQCLLVLKVLVSPLLLQPRRLTHHGHPILPARSFHPSHDYDVFLSERAVQMRIPTLPLHGFGQPIQRELEHPQRGGGAEERIARRWNLKGMSIVSRI